MPYETTELRFQRAGRLEPGNVTIGYDAPRSTKETLVVTVDSYGPTAAVARGSCPRAVLILGVALGFALGTPRRTGGAATCAYASDTAALLANDPPRHSGATRLQEIVSKSDGVRPRTRRPYRTVPPNAPDYGLYGRNTARRGRYADATGCQHRDRLDTTSGMMNDAWPAMTRRGQLVLVAATVVAVALVPILVASLQLGYHDDVRATAIALDSHETGVDETDRRNRETVTRLKRLEQRRERSVVLDEDLGLTDSRRPASRTASAIT